MSGRILIVDAVATHRIMLKVKLTGACYTVIQADSGKAAMGALASAAPELIVLDVALPDTDGIALCRRIKSDPRTAEIPVIMVADQEDGVARMRAVQAGAEELLVRPVGEARLLARVRSLLRVREADDDFQPEGASRRAGGFAEAGEGFAPPGRIAIVGQDMTRLRRWKSGLAEHLSDRINLLGQEAALFEAPRGAANDVFVISVEADGGRAALRLVSELRSRAETRNGAIVLLMPEGSCDTAAMALDLGADDVISDETGTEELALRLTRQMQRKRRRDTRRSSMRDDLRLARIDPLTGLFNRRHAMPFVSRLAARARSTERPFAIMLLDLDRFKAVNDRYGHAAGDAVLVEVARRIREHVGEGDLAARIGGEEFLVALPDTGRADGEAAARRLCEAVNAHPMELPGDSPALYASVSIGMAVGDGSLEAETLLERADAALYAAKADGRNQVTVSETAA